MCVDPMNQAVACHQSVRLIEGTVGHFRFALRELHASSLGTRLESLGGEQYSCLHHLFHVVVHDGQHIVVGHDTRYAPRMRG